MNLASSLGSCVIYQFCIISEKTIVLPGVGSSVTKTPFLGSLPGESPLARRIIDTPPSTSASERLHSTEEESKLFLKCDN